ncbi:TRAP-type C4-dicarboxylate transport system, small permease component [Modicisalibacter muralis]|uniref:TRAP transporter small permease protein n=1 Tax=Modicisalibacter muralis TaxID=119000 RepID=A0A1G9GT72_9GAMM|nr:TRAP transporter small permease [Halomonas muralis]SDL03838.1 TRAP-type C4-dicarboxylate transport system, small permease component [Halomonas muralis]
MAESSSHPVASSHGVIGAYIRCMDNLSRIAAVVAGTLLAIGVLAICHMIFMRYILGESTVWQTEFTIFSITDAMLLGTPYVLMTGGHVAVTALPDVIGGVIRKIMLLIASLVGLGFCIALSYGSWHYLIEAYNLGWTTGTVWNPLLWPALLPVAIGTSLLALQYIAEILRGES